MAETPRSSEPRSAHDTGPRDTRDTARDAPRTPTDKHGPPREGGPDHPPSPGSRSMQTKAMHDSGQYRDKIPMGDPGASPLGTDSEAAGFRAGEGSMEPTAPIGATAEPGSHPPGHARGDAPGERTAPPTESSTKKGKGNGLAIALFILAAIIALWALF